MSMRVRVGIVVLALSLAIQASPRGQQPQQASAPQPPPSQAPAPVNVFASTYQPLPSRATVIRNATILTAAGPVIERGSILLQNGKVAAVGPASTRPVMPSSSTRTASG
jgi:hypothetical protein